MSDLDWERPLKTVKLASSWKLNIIKRGLVKAKAQCPYCDGFWHGRLAGPKQHLHMYCDGNCGTLLMQ